MNKIFQIEKIIICCCLAVLAFIPLATIADEENTNQPVEEQIEVLPLKAVAGKDKNVVIGRKVLFDASSSTCPDECALDYTWDFGDGTVSYEAEPTHVYKLPDVYRAKLTVNHNDQESTDEIIVNVEKDINLLICDANTKNQEIDNLKNYSSTQQILLVDIKSESVSGDYDSIQQLTQQLLKSTDDIKQSDVLIIKTDNNLGLNALSELAQAYTEESDLKELGFNSKIIVVITPRAISTTARIAQSTYNLLEPSTIIITSEDALFSIVGASNAGDVVPTLRDGGYEYTVIGSHTQRSIEKLAPWNFMSYITSYLVNKGIPLDSIFLILILPVIATIVALSRQIIGIKAFGIYIPTIVALTFIVTGLKYGLAILVAILLAGTISRLIAKRIKVLYLPRMAIVITLVSFTILAIFVIAGYTNRSGLMAVSIFPILILTMLTENFISAQVERGFKTALRLTVESLILSIVSYYIVTFESFKLFILAYPEIILLTIIINFVIGRFKGLRLLEYIRFKNVIKNIEKR